MFFYSRYEKLFICPMNLLFNGLIGFMIYYMKSLETICICNILFKKNVSLFLFSKRKQLTKVTNSQLSSVPLILFCKNRSINQVCSESRSMQIWWDYLFHVKLIRAPTNASSTWGPQHFSRNGKKRQIITCVLFLAERTHFIELLDFKL